MRPKYFPLITLFALLCGVPSAHAQLTAQRHEQPVPSELAAPIAAALSTGGVRATAGATAIEFWFVKGLPVTDGSAWTAVEEGSLIGAVRLSAEFTDIRGRIIKPGVYTLRYGVQPSNGDHLGVSPFREFALLSPAAADKEVAARGHDGTIAISKLAVGGSHPAVWSIDPPTTEKPELSTHTTELGHQSIVVQVPLTRDGRAAGTLRFGIVLVGKIDA